MSGKRTGDNLAAEILAFPALRKVPLPDLPLQGKAYDKYMELATELLAAGKLNTYTKSQCEQVGLLHDQHHRTIGLNRIPSSASLARLDRLLRDLQVVGGSDRTAEEPKQEENRFSRYGRIIRRGAEKATIRPS